METSDKISAAGLSVTVLGAIIGIWEKVIKPFFAKRRQAKRDEQNKLLSLVNNISESVEKIKKEVEFNSGGSLKDAVVKGFKDLSERLDSIEQDAKISLNMKNIAYWISNSAGQCIYASPELCKIIGRPQEQILGNGWTGWIIPEERERIYKEWNFSIKKNTVFDEIYTYAHDDGTKIKVNGLCFHKINKIGEYTGSLGRIEVVQ